MAEKKKKPTKKKVTKKKPEKKISPKKELTYNDKPRRYWTEEDWENWGKDFGKRAESWGEDLGRRMEHHGKEFEMRVKGKWHSTFGVMGPFIETVVGFIFLLLGIWILNIINSILISGFITEITSFVLNNLAIFFGASLVFNYADYFERRYRRAFWGIAPLVMATKITFGLWILGWILNIISTSISSPTAASIASFINTNLQGIFAVILVLGYVFFMTTMSWMNRRWEY